MFFNRDVLVKVVSIAVAIVVIVGLLYGASVFLKEESSPEITVLESASMIYGFDNYTEEMSFKPGDTIYIYEEYVNISHDGVCNFTISLKVEGYNTSEFILDNINFTRYVYYNTSYDVYLVDDVERGRFWSFDTDDSWEQDVFLVTSVLEDHISGRSASASTLFFLEH